MPISLCAHKTQVAYQADHFESVSASFGVCVAASGTGAPFADPETRAMPAFDMPEQKTKNKNAGLGLHPQNHADGGDRDIQSATVVS